MTLKGEGRRNLYGYIALHMAVGFGRFVVMVVVGWGGLWGGGGSVAHS